MNNLLKFLLVGASSLFILTKNTAGFWGHRRLFFSNGTHSKSTITGNAASCNPAGGTDVSGHNMRTINRCY